MCGSQDKKMYKLLLWLAVKYFAGYSDTDSVCG